MIFTDQLLDATMDVYALGDTIHACSSEPANFAAVAGASLGSTGTAWGAIADGGGGRQRTCTPANDTTYGSSGTVTHYAIVDTSASLLIVANSVATSRAVNSGDSISLDPVTFTAVDPVSA